MKKIIVGNWKQNKPEIDLDTYFKELEKVEKDEELVIAPPYVYLPLIKSNKIVLASQDVSRYNSGSNTGEISCDMVKEFGCTYTIIGHNERRTKFNESNEEVNAKVKNALDNGMKVILCITSIEELKKSIEGVESFNNLLIALEPKEFIGTSNTISRSGLIEYIDKINKVTENKCRILYGGGIKKENIKSLSGINGLDGLLIGKASLDVESLKDIIELW